MNSDKHSIVTWVGVTTYQYDIAEGPTRNSVYPSGWSDTKTVDFDIVDLAPAARFYLKGIASRFVSDCAGVEIVLERESELILLDGGIVAMSAVCTNPFLPGVEWQVSVWAKASELESSALDDENISSGERVVTPFKPSDIRLITPPMNLGDLIDMIKEGWINFNTEYQRAGDLWGREKQSRLIESVLLGLRLPAFYFEEVSKRQWNIIDGLQRCCAVSRFCVDESMTLKGLEFLGDDFEGKKFSDFSFEIRRDIRMLPITVNLLEKGTPPDVKYILFKRLNTGGVNLTLQEIRTAMFQGRAVNVLEKMANDPNFILATGGCIPTKRQEDRDFISRFIAFYVCNYKEYVPDLERFINSAMEKIEDKMISEEAIREMMENFTAAMKLAFDIFGADAFRKRQQKNDARRPINKAYFEVIATTFAKLSEMDREVLRANAEALKDELLVLMKDRKFENSLTGGTGSRNSVRKRFGDFENVVNNILLRSRI